MFVVFRSAVLSSVANIITAAIAPPGTRPIRANARRVELHYAPTGTGPTVCPADAITIAQNKVRVAPKYAQEPRDTRLAIGLRSEIRGIVQPRPGKWLE